MNFDKIEKMDTWKVVACAVGAVVIVGAIAFAIVKFCQRKKLKSVDRYDDEDLDSTIDDLSDVADELKDTADDIKNAVTSKNKD